MRAALLLFTIASVGAAQEQPTGPHEFAWTELPKRRFNAIWVSRESGDLYISNGRTVQVTRDAGQTWEEPLAPGKKGRHWNSISFDGDWKGGRVAISSVDNPVGHLTLDAGKTWQSFAKPVPPQVKKHDGWTYGHVDWSAAEPTRLFGKEHHSGSFWFSGDAGKTWSELKGVGGYFGFGIGADGALLCSTAEGNNPVIPGEGKHGIYRSADDGQTWHLVFEGEFNQKVPHPSLRPDHVLAVESGNRTIARWRRLLEHNR